MFLSLLEVLHNNINKYHTFLQFSLDNKVGEYNVTNGFILTLDFIKSFVDGSKQHHLIDRFINCWNKRLWNIIKNVLGPEDKLLLSFHSSSPSSSPSNPSSSSISSISNISQSAGASLHEDYLAKRYELTMLANLENQPNLELSETNVHYIGDALKDKVLSKSPRTNVVCHNLLEDVTMLPFKGSIIFKGFSYISFNVGDPLLLGRWVDLKEVLAIYFQSI